MIVSIILTGNQRVTGNTLLRTDDNQCQKCIIFYPFSGSCGTAVRLNCKKAIVLGSRLTDLWLFSILPSTQCCCFRADREIILWLQRLKYIHCESKKGCHPNYGYNFVNSWWICRILSLLERPVNFQQNQY